MATDRDREIVRQWLAGEREHLTDDEGPEGPSSRLVRADELEVGTVVVEARQGFGEVRLGVEALSIGRFVHYSLSDGSDRVLSPYVEVRIA